MRRSKQKFLSNILNLYMGVGILLWVLAATLLFTPIVPLLVYSVYPDASVNERESLTQNLDKDLEKFEESQPATPPPPKDDRPPFDPALPTVNTLIIDKMGVNGAVQTGPDSEAALQKGPWMVNDFGTPDNSFAPIIIASHRWGGIGWNALQRETLSFNKLPSTNVGDQIEIVWDQRRYVYRIYKIEESTQISDYEADLILYTCKLIVPSPVRIFRYAERIN